MGAIQNGWSRPKGERRLSAVGRPERTLTSALPNASTRPIAEVRIQAVRRQLAANANKVVGYSALVCGADRCATLWSVSAIGIGSDLAGKAAGGRRLIAVVYSDVVGYSRLIGLDDAGTISRLQALRRKLIDPAVSEHGGRIAQTAGDSLLIVFDSIDGAVRCAVAVQKQIPLFDRDQPPDRAIRFRIGINIGDVIAEGTDVHGGGVNVAARLQAECPPGGICVSRAVRDHVHDRLGLTFEELGPLKLKNIARPVEAFVVRLDATAAPSESVDHSHVGDDHERGVESLVSGASLAASSLQSRAAPRLSIVVLPFVNLGDDPEQQYVADGITEDVTTDLSRIAHMMVISRNTAFTYRNKSVTTGQIGRELGVRYVLEGSVRRSGNQLRVNAQLTEAETDSHLWASRFDFGTSDQFALLNDITGRITVALNLELIGAEAIRPTEHPDALDYVLRGRAAYSKAPSREKYAEAIGWIERGLALDPQSVAAQSWLATALTGRFLDSMTDAAPADIQRAEVLAGQALAASLRSPLAHYARGQVLRTRDRYQDAIPEYETVLALDPNWVNAYNALGQCKFFNGSIEETIPLEEHAIRLSPRDPMIGNWYWAIGRVHLVQSRTEEAIFWLELACNSNPGLPVAHAYLASAYALRGDGELAAAKLAEARRLSFGDRYASLGHLKAAQSLGVPKVRALFETTYFAGLHKAGVPE
jgi:adenylate cyclase